MAGAKQATACTHAAAPSGLQVLTGLQCILNQPLLLLDFLRVLQA